MEKKINNTKKLLYFEDDKKIINALIDKIDSYQNFIIDLEIENIDSSNIDILQAILDLKNDGSKNVIINSEISRPINKSIEFPPEYYQAGLGILNYFSTYLKKNYPDSNANVRIEQENNKIRLTVTSEEGQTEVIEKAFDEYGLIMTGENKPEEFTDNRELIVELKSELRIAKARIEIQKDIISLHEADKKEFTQMLKLALNKENQPIDVKVSPIINVETTNTSTNNNTQTINIQLKGVSKLLEEIKEAATTSEQKEEVAEVAKAVQEVQNDPTKESVKKKGVITKLEGLYKNITKGMGAFTKTADTTEKAAKSAQKIYQLGERLLPYAEQLLQAVGG